MFELRVYYKDTDAEGIVYYANYLKFIEVARTEYLRDLGISVEDLAAQGIIFIVVNAHIDYHSSARHGDVLQIQTTVPQLKRASFIFAHKIINKADQRLIATIQTKFGCLSGAKPVALPAVLRAKLKPE